MSVVSGLVGHGGRRSAGYRKHITQVTPYVNDQPPHRLSGSGHAKRTIVSRDAPQQYSYRRPHSNIAKEMKKFLETQALYGSTVNVVPGTSEGPTMSSQTLVGQAAETAPQPEPPVPNLIQPSPTDSDMSIDPPQIMTNDGSTQTMMDDPPQIMTNDGGTQTMMVDPPQINVSSGGTQTYTSQGVGVTQTNNPVYYDSETQYTSNVSDRGTQSLLPNLTTSSTQTGGMAVKNPRFDLSETENTRKMQTLLPLTDVFPRGDTRTSVGVVPYNPPPNVVQPSTGLSPWVIPRPTPPPLSVVTNPQRQLTHGPVGGVANPVNISPDEPTLEQALYGGSPNSSPGELARHLSDGEANPVVVSSPSSRGSVSTRSPTGSNASYVPSSNGSSRGSSLPSPSSAGRPSSSHRSTPSAGSTSSTSSRSHTGSNASYVPSSGGSSR